VLPSLPTARAPSTYDGPALWPGPVVTFVERVFVSQTPRKTYNLPRASASYSSSPNGIALSSTRNGRDIAQLLVLLVGGTIGPGGFISRVMLRLLEPRSNDSRDKSDDM
jgi:hypothetical protein